MSPADWLMQSGAPWWQLVTFGPVGFESYARLRYISDPEHAGQAEADLSLPEDHLPDIVRARRALDELARFTDSADECYFCVWDGWGRHLDPTLPPAPLVTIPNRSYLLFAGRLAEIERDGFDQPPAFVWPADRRWCFTSDVDPHWAGIGADRLAIDALVAAPDLDVTRADPTVQPPAYG